MQGNETFYPRRLVAPLASDEVGCGYTCGIPLAPALDPTPTGSKHKGPFHGVEFQASEMCPKSFIIFDRTDDKSQIMFHPALVSNKFNYPSFDIFAISAQENDKSKGKEKDNDSFSLKEDTRDIDALMSLEVEEEEEEDEDEEVSTGRTMGNCGSSSTASSSQKHETKLSSIQKSFSCSSSSDSNNKRKQKRMMKALRRIVPGGDSMDTAMILDEAVRYLKSLKVEVKKLEMVNLEKT